jgi:hypothetical protein
MKSRRLGWTGSVARMGNEKHIHSIAFGNQKGRDQFVDEESVEEEY